MSVIKRISSSAIILLLLLSILTGCTDKAYKTTDSIKKLVQVQNPDQAASTVDSQTVSNVSPAPGPTSVPQAQPKSPAVKPTAAPAPKPAVDSSQNKSPTVKPVEAVKKPAANNSNSVTTRLIDRLKSAGDSQQVILVQASSFGTYHVKVNTYEKVDGKWKEVLTNIPGVIGYRGFSINRHEGDKTSPVGAFGFVTLFGWAKNPGVKMPYRTATVHDFWSSNMSSYETYNTWIHYEGPPVPWYTEANSLAKEPLFKYAGVIDFNYGPNKVLGKGSGIFFHVAPRSGGTLGCTAVPEDKLVKILRWMDPAKKPKIIQGPVSELNKM